MVLTKVVNVQGDAEVINLDQISSVVIESSPTVDEADCYHLTMANGAQHLIKITDVAIKTLYDAALV